MISLARLFASMWKREKNHTPLSDSDMLYIGLGNPGDRYVNTRHNAGFLAVDQLAKTLGAEFRPNSNLEAEIAEINHNGARIILAKPQTFMNLSGRAVQKLIHYVHATPEHVTIFYDDITLPVGEWDVRSTPTSGSHNGMRSVKEYVSTPLRRVRIGVGAVPERWQMSDWVLSRFTKEEQAVLADTLAQISTELLAS